MATLSLLCRLKLLSFVSVASSNELSRSLLIKSNNENERPSLPSDKSLDDVLDKIKGNTRGEHRRRGTKEGWLVCVAKDVVTRYESPSTIFLTINEGMNTFSGTLSTRNICTRKREDSAKRMPNVQRNFLFDKRSPIVSHFALATIYHTWMFSKDACPSTRYLCSNSTPRTRSPVNDSTREDLLSGKDSEGSKNPCRMIIPSYENVRSFSSCRKGSKSDKCPDDMASEEQQLSEDTCSSTRLDPCDPVDSSKECQESSRPCKSHDRKPICSSSPCPNIQDYCPPQESYKEKFWQFLVCFVLMPVLIITSIFVYSKEMENRKRPRPEYEQVPWMGLMVKPFPWGDGKRSLFHNPAKNPIPGRGYEVEDPHATKKTKPEETKK